MKVIVEFSIIPIGDGVSLSNYIAECERILKSKNLKIQLHAEGTNIEGELDEILATIKQCIKAVHEMGAPRISTNVKISSRVDKAQSMEDRVISVEGKV